MSDTLSLEGGSAVGGYTTPVAYRPVPGGGAPMDYPTHTVPRNYHYGPPPGSYNDYRGGPPSDAYASLNRGANMDDRYRYVLMWKSQVPIQLFSLKDQIVSSHWLR